MNVFNRYAPFIQDFIYRSGWQTLRGVQNAAGEAIFGGQDAWGSRIVYTVIALAALWCISLFFRDTPVTREE